MTNMDCDILVVGLGPVGAAAAVLGRLHGLSVIAIDRDSDIYPLPRAAGFDHEAMRIFQAMGIADLCERQCRTMGGCQFVTANKEVLLDFSSDELGPYGWAPSYALYQPVVENALRGRMAELGADIRLGVRFTSLTQDNDGVVANVEGVAGRSQIRSRYLVGCDGARSLVRDAMDTSLFDYDFDEPWLVIDTVADDEANLPRIFQQVCDPARPVTYIWIGGNRFRWEFMLKPGETPEEMLRDECVHALLKPWNALQHITIERKAVYRFHGLVSENWRQGRVFIAGDAAHQMPPFAGQGMCSGIRDAMNLIWKLAAVINSAADQSILDSYQVERDPHVRAIIEQAIHIGRIVCMQDPVAAAARDVEMLKRRAAGAVDALPVFPDLKGGLLTQLPEAGALFIQPLSRDGKRFDELVGTSAVLIGRDLEDIEASDVRVLDIRMPELAPFSEQLGGWLDKVREPAVLVRPDRHVFGTGEPFMLLQSWRQMLRRDNTIDDDSVLRGLVAAPLR